MKAIIGETILASRVRVAETFFQRLIGLMGTKEMIGYDALLIPHCNSIHTFFMRMDIDVIFLNSQYEVVKVIKNMKPWRMSWIYFTAKHVLELKAGTVNNIEKGQKLVMNV
ncbi:DUF192 domain-containing protein [Halobacteriovorax sp. GB3]|uniref:DUF192 domain-containing protein n=1 Tax=Halobacteriovorax sp. GB3 TaxID=2719615 RepID=UPI0023619C54|nr:DUF192 domain-containing protein [Halobacteriovorax sp. GB3]MDD0854452.1 DUF192 domain-containing protein [Halobacteriovorax sp. GB3]